MSNKPKKLVVLSDGTWCSRETGTVTNISMLATAIGIDMSHTLSSTPPSKPIIASIDDKARGVKARYFDGCGLGGTFLEYLFNGATASDIGKDCLEIYQYIVENFDDKTEIWVFGHSRGSYTVRCIAGMINNCGIIKPRATTEQTVSLCQEVYKMYRSPYDDEKPDSEKMVRFRKQASWNLDGPQGEKTSSIKFMGLVDTVGSLGIPRLDAGVGFDWPEFYDQNISGEVEKVYHACSMHDRLWMFQPCRARRDPDKKYETTRPELAIYEKWFPGCHYDVGRQKFKFLRDGVNAVEQLLFRIPSLLTKPVIPNETCADMVLLWMLEGVRKEDESGTVIKDVEAETKKIKRRLLSGNQEVGSGDVYGNMLDYTPAGIFGSAIGWLSDMAVHVGDRLSPSLKLGSAIQEMLGIKTIANILLATRDRRIPGETADTVQLRIPESLLGGATVEQKAALERKEKGSYASKTYDSFQAYLLAINTINQQTFDMRTGSA